MTSEMMTTTRFELIVFDCLCWFVHPSPSRFRFDQAKNGRFVFRVVFSTIANELCVDSKWVVSSGSINPMLNERSYCQSSRSLRCPSTTERFSTYTRLATARLKRPVLAGPTPIVRHDSTGNPVCVAGPDKAKHLSRRLLRSVQQSSSASITSHSISHSISSACSRVVTWRPFHCGFSLVGRDPELAGLVGAEASDLHEWHSQVWQARAASTNHVIRAWLTNDANRIDARFSKHNSRRRSWRRAHVPRTVGRRLQTLTATHLCHTICSPIQPNEAKIILNLDFTINAFHLKSVRTFVRRITRMHLNPMRQVSEGNTCHLFRALLVCSFVFVARN